MSELVSVKDLTVDYLHDGQALTAVKNVSFTIERGRTLGLVGESGCGKSTLALALIGLLPKNASRIPSGSIEFDGKDLLDQNDEQWRAVRGRRIAMIFQDPFSSLNPVLTIEYQLKETLALDQPNPNREQLLELMQAVQLPDPDRILRSYPHQISGGQRQRIMIANALARKPELLIADEPTTALDVTVQAEIISLLKSLQTKLNMTMLFVTHNLGLVNNVSDDLAIMQAGQIVERGPTREILTRPQHPYTQQLLKSVPTLQTKPAAASTSTLMLTIDGISKTFVGSSDVFLGKKQRVQAVKTVSARVAGGESLGIVGESGSGKTTLAKILAGFLDADQGSAQLDGINLLTCSRKKRATLAQMVFQDPFASLNPKLLLESQLFEALKTRGKNRVEERAAELMDDVGLPVEFLKRYPHQISGGQRQRFAIARALAAEPTLLIADEPVSSLDVTVQAQIIQLLNTLRARRKFIQILISHDLTVIANTCEQVIVMKDGEIVETGTVEKTLSRPEHPYTQRLLAATPHL